MHDDRFDHLTRRRAAMTGLFSAGLLALAARLAPDTAARKRRKRKKRKKKKRNKRTCLTCGPGTKECQGSCIPSGDCCGGCGNQTCCNGTCTDLATDGANCGVCGNACVTNVCRHGVCACNGTGEDCPVCGVCVSRLEGGSACGGGGAGGPCASDDDCPFRSFCATNGLCQGACGT